MLKNCIAVIGWGAAHYREALARLCADVLVLPPCPGMDRRVSSHPDMLMTVIGRDVIVPLMHWNGRLLAMDGHTRLYCAVQKGIDRVRGYMEENEEILFFAQEAQRRGIYTVHDMQLLPHNEYEHKWNRFCDEYFDAKRKDG